MLVDTHVHVWEIDPPKYPVGPTAPNWNSYPDEPGTADELLAEMDEPGVDWAVLVQSSGSTWDNGYIADSAARFPDRFVGHGLIDPQDADNAAQVRYWVKERGLAGFRFHPMYYPEEKILLTEQNGPLWEEIAALETGYRLGRLMVYRGALGEGSADYSAGTKAFCTEHEQRVAQFAARVLGPAATVGDAVPAAVCYAPAYTIQGGTSAIMRNIIGERILGLPREPR